MIHRLIRRIFHRQENQSSCEASTRRLPGVNTAGRDVHPLITPKSGYFSMFL